MAKMFLFVDADKIDKPEFEKIRKLVSELNAGKPEIK